MIFPAISVKQPWPYAILHLGKNVENRNWALPYKFRGVTVLIHAGKREDAAGEMHLRYDIGYAIPDNLPLGGIVGALTFRRQMKPGLRSPWAEPGLHWWPIDSAWPLEFFPCRGRLGFFEVDYPYEVQHGRRQAC